MRARSIRLLCHRRLRLLRIIGVNSVATCDISLLLRPKTPSFWCVSTRRKATALKLTLDSSEPLEDAMRVVGALYGVTLAVSANQAEGPPSVEQDKGPAARSKKAVGKTPGGKRAASAPRARARALNTLPTGSPGPASSNNAEVRSWARQSGLTINDRGKIPASVMAAYRDSHAG
ncbi:MAG: histone-like nucleoid-structuring protein Lsr2 [Nocardioidaceae bacterium]